MKIRALLAAATVAVSTLSAPVAASAAAATTTITIDPSYHGAEWEGWGTSLAWLADATGGYPDEIRNKLADMLYGPTGLNLNIARYNIGGGNAPTVKPYLRPGGAVPGWWKAPATYTPADKDWWDPDNPQHWNWQADQNQRWWVDKIKKRVDHWETFSNSPPWFQTVSGYVSGGFDPNTDQIRTETLDEFSTYLLRVTEFLEKKHKIKVDTIEPLNEPNTNYWRTTLGADGQPTGGRQEGAHAGPALQAAVLESLRRIAPHRGIAGPDETNPGTLVTDWYGYTPAAKEAVDRINVHTYGTGQRTSVRDIAKAEQKSLWMSEVEGSWGKDFTSMDSGLGMAQRIIDDLRELEPTAWVLWQPVEDAKNMIAEGNLQWGAIHVPFDCGKNDTLATCPIQTNTKFDTIRNFTHYIRPGDRLVKVDGTRSVAAASKRGLTVVHSNPAVTAENVTLDLSKFEVDKSAKVTPIVTSASGKLVKGTAVQVTDKRVTLTVPAQSVTTFLVSSVRDDGESHLRAGRTYRFEGTASGRSMTPSGTDVVIRTNSTTAADQLWTVQESDVHERYQLINAGTGQRLAVRDGAAVAETAGAVDDGALWRFSSTGDGTYTLVNVGERRLLDVNGGSTGDGSRVGTYIPTGGSNQRWRLKDETVGRTEIALTHTVPGQAPVLPATVTAVLPSGENRALPVTWTLPPAEKWNTPGTVLVTGTATDALGKKVPATAKVSVDVFTSTVAGRAKAYVGGTASMPSTVTALGKNGGTATVPVVWTAASFPKLGVTEVTGTATVAPGQTLPATARVQVTPPSEGPLAGASVTASYTEPGYSTAGLTNGDITDKAWSNWKGSGRNPVETLTATLPAGRTAHRAVLHFYRDNSSGGGVAATVQAGTVSAAGCQVVGSPIAVTSAVVDIPLTPGSTSFCLRLTPTPDGYLTVSELQVYAAAPGVGSDSSVSSILVDGVAIGSFDPAVTSWQVPARDPSSAQVTAVTTDPYATVEVTGSGKARTVVTTSEDGSSRTTYRVTLVRRD
ncbi:RICIN domain-containing protein [Actinoplanes sp. NEAU-A12]|uniref:RICIN domain-containing protein n=1 Tax=Actinoplanes sandaracinus TaxID=3045177 RepID=A0ABT6WQ29_9ACTN|nr:RICIN domain-containing protein [Actinoplanes sandaracinus]MDI6101818.1 RICIN domain-containing protein [Actinoplanes sandaracinus]